MTPEHYEYAILGGGKGGKALAVDLASSGHRVVLVERQTNGGPTIHVACLPIKSMVRSAKVAFLTRHSAEYGVRADYHGVDPVGVHRRRHAIVDGLTRITHTRFEQSRMTLLHGAARFTGPRAVEVHLTDGSLRHFTAERVFINTGTRPAPPPVHLGEIAALTNETILDLDHLPEHLLVLGGGCVGIECAHLFRRFGSRVTILERNPRFLPREDEDVAEQVVTLLREDGIKVVLGVEVRGIEGRSGESVRVQVHSPHGVRVEEGTHLLAALGRIPNTERLDLPAAGVELDERGYVKVNERLETTAAGVWALGDVHGGPPYSHASLDDYRIIKANLFGGQRSTHQRLVPYTLFIDPELARIGLTEAEARRQGYDVRVARLPVAAIARARMMSETRGMLKAILDGATERILGAAVLAPEGGEIVSVIQIAMQAGLPYTALRDSIFAHPTMAEGLNDLFTHVEPPIRHTVSE